ncbi:hypothetical protein GS881_24450 [Rhodococcus hoagii]|nr:hypothetical protein [Prescottella equi]
MVFHCSAGRTAPAGSRHCCKRLGGASPEDVMADYLASNDYLADVNAGRSRRSAAPSATRPL